MNTMNSERSEIPREPVGELVIKTMAMPADTNPSGDVFGGWLLSLMDVGGGIMARKISEKRVTTVAITAMRFWNPVHVGDTVCVYAELQKVGNTSMTFRLTAWAQPYKADSVYLLVTDALFTYVSIDEKGRPIQVKSS
jgi:acyl-CoA thioesterase YciA